LGIATFVPPLFAYLNLDKKRSAVKESPKAKASVDNLGKPQRAIAQPPKAESPPGNPYTRDPLITPVQIQEGLKSLKSFLLKQFRQVMK
jgi:hypothetical protein